MAKVGCKGKLTKEIIQQAAEARALGTPVKTICDALFISEFTWYEWIKKGKEKNDERTLYTQFSKAIKKAKSESITKNLKNIQDAADKGIWQASAWKLERLDRENFGRDNPQEEQKPINITITTGEAIPDKEAE